MAEQIHEISGELTEMVRFSIPRLGLYGVIDLPVLNTRVMGPGMDGEIISDGRSQDRVPLRIPRLGIVEAIDE